MKKRILSMLLAVAMLLAACGSKDPETPKTTTTPTQTTPTQTTGQAQHQERDVRMGVLEGNTYTNEYVGIGITMDADWTAIPAEELQELPDNLREMFKGTDLENVKLTQFTDVMAENATLMVNFNVLYQKLGLQERLAYSLMNESQILDTVLAMKDTLIDAYANAGIAVEKIEKKNVTFLGEDRVAMYTVASVQGIPYYILQLYDYHLGAYGITFTAGSFYEDNTLSVLDMFYSLEK